MKMDEASSARQINQMVAFILNEAKDKAEEIDAKSLEEFNIEKTKYVKEAKDKIRAEYDVKLKKQETQVAIGRSTAINAARLKKVEARQGSLISLKQICTNEFNQVTADRAKYANICADLIVQGCLKLIEDEVTVQCRQQDVDVMKAALDVASRKYTEILNRETGVKKGVLLAVSNDFLNKNCGGGVVLSCNGGAITIDNTLSTRLNLVFDNDLPALRSMLFPTR